MLCFAQKIFILLRMKYRLFPLVFVLALVACSAGEPEQETLTATGDTLEDAAILEQDLEVIDEELLQEAQEAEVEEISSDEALRLSYEDAVQMQEVMALLANDMAPELRDAMTEVLDAFDIDVESLRYYVELSQREPLLEDDQREVLELSASIEEAMALFAEVIEITF